MLIQGWVYGQGRGDSPALRSSDHTFGSEESSEKEKGVGCRPETISGREWWGKMSLFLRRGEDGVVSWGGGRARESHALWTRD